MVSRMDNNEIRLRLVEAVMRRAHEFDMRDMTTIVDKCSQLEEYVLSSAQGNKPESPSRSKQPRPRKEKTEIVVENGIPGPTK